MQEIVVLPDFRHDADDSDEEEDVHFCTKCKKTITGLQVYIAHRRDGPCGKGSKKRKHGHDMDVNGQPSTSGNGYNHRHLSIDPVTEDDLDTFMPPRGHTGGKWVPGQNPDNSRTRASLSNHHHNAASIGSEPIDFIFEPAGIHFPNLVTSPDFSSGTSNRTSASSIQEISPVQNALPLSSNVVRPSIATPTRRSTRVTEPVSYSTKRKRSTPSETIPNSTIQGNGFLKQPIVAKHFMRTSINLSLEVLSSNLESRDPRHEDENSTNATNSTAIIDSPANRKLLKRKREAKKACELSIASSLSDNTRSRAATRNIATNLSSSEVAEVLSEKINRNVNGNKEVPSESVSLTTSCDNCFHLPLKSSNYVLKHLLLDKEHRTGFENYADEIDEDIEDIESRVAYTFPFVCDVCSFYATQLSSFIWHLNSPDHSKRAMFSVVTCTRCSRVSKSIQDVLEHFKSEKTNIKRKDEDHLGTLLVCTVQKEVEFEKVTYGRKKVLRRKPRLFYCAMQKCKNDFPTYFALKQHFNKHHRKFDFPQTVVKYKKKPKGSFVPRLPIVGSDGTYLCEICGTVINSASSMYGHLYRHKRDASYVEGMKFKCPVEGCQGAFGIRGQLKKHMDVHNSPTSFLCDKCPYTGKTKRMLEAHLLRHLDYKPFACKLCDFRAKGRGNLQQHMAQHTGVKPFKCVYCDYTCTCIGNLKKHILNTAKHAGLALYPCKDCDFRTNFFLEYQRHVRASHQDLYAPEDMKKHLEKSMYRVTTTVNNP